MSLVVLVPDELLVLPLEDEAARPVADRHGRHDGHRGRHLVHPVRLAQRRHLEHLHCWRWLSPRRRRGRWRTLP